MAEKSTDERVHIQGEVPNPQGPGVFDLPSKFVFLSDCLGDAATNYATAKPVKVTRENMARLAGLKPELRDLAVSYVDPITGAPQRLAIPTLIFTRTPEHWPAAIIEQVERLRGLRTLLDALVEAKRNPRVLAQLNKWLADQRSAAASPASNPCLSNRAPTISNPLTLTGEFHGQAE